MDVKTRLSAPELTSSLEWFNTGQPLDLMQLRGRIVLLDFWTFSSINSMHVLPDLRYLENKYPDALAVIGIHSPKFQNERSGSQLQKAINRHHIRHPVANDPKFELWRAYGIKAWPTIVVIDHEGAVVGMLRGEGRRRQLDELIQKLIANAEKDGCLAPRKTEVSLKPEPRTLLSFPGKVCATRNKLFIADSGRNRILETFHDGRIRRIFGGGSPDLLDGQELSASFNNPQGMVFAGDFLYVADTGNHAIRRIQIQTGEVLTLAGDGEQGRYLADRFPDPVQAKLNSPWDLAYYESDLYIAMAGQHQIWRMNLNHGTMVRFAGSGREDLVDGPGEYADLSQPMGLVVDDNQLYIADAGTSAIRKVTLSDNQIATLTGKGMFDFGDRDGIGKEARLQYPKGLVIDKERNALWIADTYNSKIKRMELATCQISKFKFDYPLDEPGGISLVNNKLYIANTNAHEIVCLDLQSRQAEVVDVHE